MPISFEKLKESLINQINNPENFNGKFIYFMSSPGNNLVKIGISNNPYTRLKSVNNSVPFDVNLLAFFPDNGFFEKSLHEHFKEYKYTKVGNEWFLKNNDLNKLISIIQSNKDKIPELNKEVQLSMRLPANLKLQLKILAVKKGISLNKLVTGYIEEGLTKDEKQSK